MILNILSITVGIVCLYFGAEWLVSGTTALARLLGIPAIIVGLTVVAYGTSSPEIVVGIKAALSHHGDIVIGNVLGSNIANIGLILGSSVLVSPARVSGDLVKREVPVLLLSAVILPFMVLDGMVTRLEGGTLVVLALLYTWWMIRDARRSMAEALKSVRLTQDVAEEAGGLTSKSTNQLFGYALVGLVVLIAGGSFLVDGASSLALSIGMSERLVGLTIVAVGTSLPELAASLLAARRGHSDIAVGNVVGSNIFNIFLCLGAAALVAPLHITTEAIALDMTVLIGATMVAGFMIRCDRNLLRTEGAMLLVGYLLYVGILVLH